MSTIDAHSAATAGESGRVVSAVRAVIDWSVAADHKRVGRLLAGGAVFSTIAVAVVGALLGFERITTTAFEVMPIGSSDELMSFFRHGLTWLVLAPLFLGIAVAVVPMQVGARALALGRLAQFGTWSWLFGAVLAVVSFSANGGPTGGREDLVHLYMFSLMMTFVGLASVALAVVVTVLTARAPGMDLMRAPAFSWSALVGGTAIVLTMPVALGTTIYHYVERAYLGVDLEEGARVLADTRWASTQPSTVIFVVCALGLVAEIAAVTFRTRLPARALLLVGLGLASTGLLTGITQTQHVLVLDGPTSDDVTSLIVYGLFNLLPVLGALIVLASLALAARAGSVRINGPLIAALFGLIAVLVAGAASAVQHIGDLELIGTVYEEAVSTLLTYGAVVAAMGAIAWWLPKWTGRKVADSRLVPSVGLAVIGIVLSSVPYVVAGFDGQPASVLTGYEYSGTGGLWSTLVGVGHVLVALAVVSFAAAVLKSSRSGELAGDDPWGGHTLEWMIPSPAPSDNFASLPTVGSAEPLLDLKPAAGGAA